MDAKELLQSIGVKTVDTLYDKSTFIDTKTPSGILKKFYFQLEGQGYFVKAGEINGLDFSYLFPVAEIIAYEIGKLIGVNVCPCELWEVSAHNFLDESEYSIYQKNSKLFSKGSIDEYLKSNGKILVSVTKEFTSNLNQLQKAAELSVNSKGRQMYDDYLKSKLFDGPTLSGMLLFDYVICNIDRHDHNFGWILWDDSTLEPAPFYDNGRSLLSDFLDEYLEEYGIESFFDYRMKPYDSTFDSAIQWVDPKHVSHINWHVSEDKLLSIVEKYSMFLSPIRKDLVKLLLKGRWNRAKKLLFET